MTNTMPMLTDSERNSLVMALEILREDFGKSAIPAVLKAIDIALAALTAAPYIYRDSLGCYVTPRKGEKLQREGELATALYTAPPVPALKPIELPSAFTPCISVVGPSPISAMRLDHMGGWLNKARVVATLREAGYEVKE